MSVPVRLSRSSLASTVLFGLLIPLAVARSGAAPPTPDASSEAPLPGEEVKVRAVPEFQKEVSGKFSDPTAQTLVDSLRAQTGVNLTLDASVIQDRPIQGESVFAKVPAWIVVQGLARNKYIEGSWRKIGNEYRLFATY